jgi:hypothetical protein
MLSGTGTGAHISSLAAIFFFAYDDHAWEMGYREQVIKDNI